MTHRPAQTLASNRMRQNEGFLSGHGFSHAVCAAKSKRLWPLRYASPSFAAVYISNPENTVHRLFAAVRKRLRGEMSSRTQPRLPLSRMSVRDLLFPPDARFGITSVTQFAFS